MSRLVWYHFSDFHFRVSEEFDRSVVLAALFDDIRRQMASGLVPDFAVLTGDISWSGQPDEFKRAEAEFLLPFLELGNLAWEDVFMVPGNHDVDREALSDLNPDKIAALRGRDEVNRFLGNSRTLQRYLAAFDPYYTFAAATGSDSRAAESALGYLRFRKDSRTAIVGLNSAWTSGYTALPGRTPSEQGHLVVGERQILDLLPKPDDTDLVIALLHHPLTWLADFDRAAIEPILASRVDIVHHGHVHQPGELRTLGTVAGGYLNLGAGAAYDRRVGTEPYLNSYSIVDFDQTDRAVTVTVRKYVDSPRPRWTSHEDLMGEGTHGRKRFPLPSSLTGGTPTKRSGTLDRFGSLRDLFRSIGSHGEFFSSADVSLVREATAEGLELANTLDQLVVSWLNATSVQPTLHLVSAILVSRAILLVSSRPEVSPDLSSILSVARERILPRSGWPEVVSAINDARSLWEQIGADFDAAPYGLTERMNADVSQSTVPVFLGISLLLLSDASLASSVLPGELPHQAEDGTMIQLDPPSGGKIRKGVAHISVVARSVQQFVTLSVIRFYLEVRLEHLADVCSSVSEQFGLSGLQLHFISRPKDWSEHRFTVDPIRVIRLLMGEELYGSGSRDIWFRELLQNAVDATIARSHLDANDPGGEVVFEYRVAERRAIFRDNGVGMTRDHILRFLCRAGRSIWRSEELKKFVHQTKAATAKTSLGKFGIGFLSVFQVAERVDVTTEFFRDPDSSQALKITNLEQPFFIRPTAPRGSGTEIAVTLKADYHPDFDSIKRSYVTYKPNAVSLRGLDDIAAGPQEALKRLILESMRSWAGDQESVSWEISHVLFPHLDATLHVAVPLTWATTTDKAGGEEKPARIDRTVLRVANGGITVLEKASEWLGDEKRGDDPSSGVRGVHALLDFATGTAPVTASRNELKLSDTEAMRIVEAVRNLAIEGWSTFAEQLFSEEKDPVLATKRLIRVMCNSALPPSGWYRRNDWSDHESILRAAKDLLVSKGHIELYEGANLDPASARPISELASSDDPVAVATRGQRKNPLFQLYASRTENFRVALATDRRAVGLLSSCGLGWVKLASDEDLWSAMHIEEDREARLTQLVPAEVAIVGSEYFLDKSALMIVLPRKRARAEKVEGLTRISSRIPPRVLLNSDHAIVQALDAALKGDRAPGHEVRRAFELLMAAVVDEKAKGRRERRFRTTVLPDLVRLAELPEGTEATFVG